MPSLHHFIYLFIFKIFDVSFLGHFEISSRNSPDMSLVAPAKNAYSGLLYTGPYGESLSLLLPCAHTPPFKNFSDLVSNWNVFMKSLYSMFSEQRRWWISSLSGAIRPIVLGQKEPSMFYRNYCFISHKTNKMKWKLGSCLMFISEYFLTSK